MYEIFKISMALLWSVFIGSAAFGLGILATTSFTDNRVCQGTLSGIVAGIGFILSLVNLHKSYLKA